jgi:hypothetical protein
MSDDRFARQNRYGPPPEFPLASSCTRIVRHLSGPNMHALSPPHRRCGRDGTIVRPGKARDPISANRVGLYFHCAFRFNNPITRAHVRLLGPCFKTGRMGNRQNIKARRRSHRHQHLHHKTEARNWAPDRATQMQQLAS